MRNGLTGVELEEWIARKLRVRYFIRAYDAARVERGVVGEIMRRFKTDGVFREFAVQRRHAFQIQLIELVRDVEIPPDVEVNGRTFE